MLDLRVVVRVSWRAGVVWRRDLLRCRRTWWTSLVPPLLEPVFYLLAFGAVLGRYVGEVTDAGSRASYLSFLAPGLVAVGVAARSARETTFGAFPRLQRGGTLEALLATPLSPEDIVFGEILWATTHSLLVAGATLAAAWACGVEAWSSWWWVVALATLGGLLFGSAGMCFTAVCSTSSSLRLPMFLLLVPLALFSGTFFPVDALPWWAARAAWASPLTHLASLTRGAMLHRAPPHLGAGLGYLGGAALLLLVMALSLMRRRILR